MQKNRFEELDSLRGIAAIAVAFFHYTAKQPQAELGFKFGGTAVDLFFIISGFVIFLSLGSIPSWKDFVKRRALRLYPTYWVCVTITTLVIIFNHYYLFEKGWPLLKQFVVNLTMFQYYVKVFDMDGPYWTLAIELMFYIVIMFLIILKQIKNIEIIGCAVLLFSVVLQLIMTPSHAELYKHVVAAAVLLNHWPLFFAGILYYKQRSIGETKLRYALIALCYGVGIYLFKYSSRAVIEMSLSQYIIILTGYFIVFLLLIKDKLSFIKIKPLLFLGNISYTFYLLHQYIGRDFIITRLMTEYNMGFWPSCFIALATCIILAYIVTKYIEVPVRKGLKRLMYPENKIVTA